ncbi:hypothetical protein IV203_015251 [Nitzschia inconspicua]|uniref:Uncharacterized protein n=1 Tax=Nitzschia inconspicua TaxID=303405 RepID=A0A9K3PT39_9STRA|nr:hypothetical protein IV203_015251 [Nitzschia inconspicua]
MSASASDDDDDEDIRFMGVEGTDHPIGELQRHKIFEHNKRQHKPSLPLLKQALHRRNPLLKGYKNRSVAYMLQKLQAEEFKLSTIDMDYLQSTILEYKTACEDKIRDSTSESPASEGPAAPTSPRITTDDRLRLIEAFLCDEARQKRRSTQEHLTRQQLDARNSDMAVEDYFETMSGNGGQQRSDDAPDWCRFDPVLVEDGDNRQNFLPGGSANMYYLLYYWHKLDTVGYLQFTLTKLPDCVKASSEEYNLVSASTTKRHKASNTQSDATSSELASLSKSMQQRLEHDQRRLQYDERRLANDERATNTRIRIELMEKIMQLDERLEAMDNGDDEERADDNEIVLAPFNNPTTAQRRPNDVVRQLAPSFNAVPAEKTKSDMSSASFKDLLYDLKDILDLEDVGKTPIPKDTVTENWALTNCLELLQTAVTQSTEAKEAKEELKQLKHGMVRGYGLWLAAKLERRALDMLFVLKGDDPTTGWRKKGKKPTGKFRSLGGRVYAYKNELIKKLGLDKQHSKVAPKDQPLIFWNNAMAHKSGTPPGQQSIARLLRKHAPTPTVDASRTAASVTVPMPAYAAGQQTWTTPAIV